ncbi:Crp/Fnr family transcriptional regulator [Seonamhaeicola sediminis]|uniref:Crp/Fnr family transcriptional regulator n=1 Tax=Seonamhaeicola sediminis TaxID=2528206 RepID=A0A562YDP0_9FLAO|nr:Crp/Fnr family transcriptional regulator [Seonamhaeicola sediminis]TWO32639.1 Crp/Fnr family transcriptional regulator [Seonamhaeicola sediminis]
MTVSKYNNLFSIVLLNSVVPLSKSLNKYLSQRIVVKSFKKGDFIISKGEVPDRLYIIRKGLVRGFFMHNNNEITTWASVDNELVTSISGFFRNNAALENIQCLEDTQTESLSFEELHFTLNNFPEMERLYRTLLEQYYIEAEYRALAARIPIAKDRYDYYMKIVNPEIFERLPKKYLASLLNMRPETLSRLQTDCSII